VGDLIKKRKNRKKGWGGIRAGGVVCRGGIYGCPARKAKTSARKSLTQKKKKKKKKKKKSTRRGGGMGKTELNEERVRKRRNKNKGARCTLRGERPDLQERNCSKEGRRVESGVGMTWGKVPAGEQQI